METPIHFSPNEQDAVNLSILEAVGLDAESAIRVALQGLAAEMTPIALALREDLALAA